MPIHSRIYLVSLQPASLALRSAERERVSAANVASTMIAMLVNNPLAEQLDLTSLRVLSCGGSPQSPAGVGLEAHMRCGLGSRLPQQWQLLETYAALGAAPCCLASHPKPYNLPSLLPTPVVVRAIALFGCEFFLSYGMTECCGKISMSILPEGAPQRMPGGWRWGEGKKGRREGGLCATCCH